MQRAWVLVEQELQVSPISRREPSGQIEMTRVVEALDFFGLSSASFDMRIAKHLLLGTLSLTVAGMPLQQARAFEGTEEVKTEENASTPVEAETENAKTEASSERVELRNGGRLQGEIVELLPGDSLSIVSAATGKAKTIPWSDVARYTRDGAWIDVPETQDDETETVEPSGGPRIHIDVKGGRTMDLQQITSRSFAVGSIGGSSAAVHGITFKKACSTPCDKTLDLEQGDQFFVTGARLTPSKAFTISPDSDTVSVRPGSRGLRIGGVILASTGVSVLALGTAFLVVNLLVEEDNHAAAIGFMASGGVVLAGGIVMAVLGRTRVSVRSRGIGLLRPLRFG